MSDNPRLKRQININRRNMLLGGATLAATAVATNGPMQLAKAQQQPTGSSGKKQNILVIFGDDIGQSDISAYTFGLMGYRTPNIDRLAKEGMMFTDYYAEQSCTAGTIVVYYRAGDLANWPFQGRPSRRHAWPAGAGHHDR